MFRVYTGQLVTIKTTRRPSRSDRAPPREQPRMLVKAQHEAATEISLSMIMIQDRRRPIHEASSKERLRAGSCWRLDTRRLLKAMVVDMVRPDPRQQQNVAYHCS